MITFSAARLTEIFNNFQGKKIAVIGDLMLDKYIWGSVSRISPEAPVPVVDVLRESNSLGGSANVINNINSLGGIAIPIGIIGDDLNSKTLLKLISDKHSELDGIIVDQAIPTTVKTRIIAHNQHVVRIDMENRGLISDDTEKKIIDFIAYNIRIFDGIIIEDYNKGVITKILIDVINEKAKKFDVPISVDPKFINFFEFKNVKIFKPNRKEAESALGMKIEDDGSTKDAMKILIDRLKCENILLTRGEKGMALLESNGEVSFIHTKARSIADVSGAGDTVISTMTTALIGNATIKEAATIANFAGGIVCGEIGAVPIDKDLLYNTIMDDQKSNN